VKTPGSTLTDQMAAMEDLAILTGGRAFTKSAGKASTASPPEDLGQARRAWPTVSTSHRGRQRQPTRLRQHIANCAAPSRR